VTSEASLLSAAISLRSIKSSLNLRVPASNCFKPSPNLSLRYV